MPSAPPKVAETVVRLLIPPACREEILGDLHERYTCPRQYLMDALRTVPLVIASRVRRTTDPQVILMEAFVLYISFLGAAWYLDGTVLNEKWGLLRLANPPAIALVALMLDDAYAKPGKQSPLNPIRGAALSLGVAFLSQAVLLAVSQKLALPRWTMFYGGGMGLVLVSTIRMLFPPVADRLQGANGPVFWLKEAGEPLKMSPRVIRVAIGVVIAVAVLGACIGHPPLLRPRFLGTAVALLVIYSLSKRL